MLCVYLCGQSDNEVYADFICLCFNTAHKELFVDSASCISHMEPLQDTETDICIYYNMPEDAATQFSPDSGVLIHLIDNSDSAYTTEPKTLRYAHRLEQEGGQEEIGLTLFSLITMRLDQNDTLPCN